MSLRTLRDPSACSCDAKSAAALMSAFAATIGRLRLHSHQNIPFLSRQGGLSDAKKIIGVVGEVMCAPKHSNASGCHDQVTGAQRSVLKERNRAALPVFGAATTRAVYSRAIAKCYRQFPVVLPVARSRIVDLVGARFQIEYLCGRSWALSIA